MSRDTFLCMLGEYRDADYSCLLFRRYVAISEQHGRIAKAKRFVSGPRRTSEWTQHERRIEESGEELGVRMLAAYRRSCIMHAPAVVVNRRHQHSNPVVVQVDIHSSSCLSMLPADRTCLAMRLTARIVRDRTQKCVLSSHLTPKCFPNTIHRPPGNHTVRHPRSAHCLLVCHLPSYACCLFYPTMRYFLFLLVVRGGGDGGL